MEHFVLRVGDELAARSFGHLRDRDTVHSVECPSSSEKPDDIGAGSLPSEFLTLMTMYGREETDE